MSGTSCDAVDAVVLRVCPPGTPTPIPVLGSASRSLGPTGTELLAISHGARRTSGEIRNAVAMLTNIHAEAISAAVHDAGVNPELIACHGQTLFHRDGLSWQAVAPAPIARRFNAPVVHDLRSADIAAGGQGAPITPMADRFLYADHAPAAIVNLGGYCNITSLDSDGHTEGRDVCVCNQLLDHAAVRLLGTPYDRDGACALQRRADPDATAAITSVLSPEHATSPTKWACLLKPAKRWRSPRSGYAASMDNRSRSRESPAAPPRLRSRGAGRSPRMVRGRSVQV